MLRELTREETVYVSNDKITSSRRNTRPRSLSRLQTGLWLAVPGLVDHVHFGDLLVANHLSSDIYCLTKCTDGISLIA